MSLQKLIIGMDYGTDSVRAMIIEADKGTKLASEVSWTPETA